MQPQGDAAKPAAAPAAKAADLPLDRSARPTGPIAPGPQIAPPPVSGKKAVADIYDKLEYGPAPEAADTAYAWLDSHERTFGNFINGQVCVQHKQHTHTQALVSFPCLSSFVVMS